MRRTMELLLADRVAADHLKVLRIPNDADPLAFDLEGVQRIELDFPKHTDGRAFSQAQLLRRRGKFTGDVRATGAVLVDWLVHMQRSGFSSAVLREDQSFESAQRQFDRYPEFYQGDVQDLRPRFVRVAA
jgi:uncharacterized protein (DUF934 family)